ncbi:hypothetical protein [Asticcacaulis sp. AND118]|uniref:DUF6898 family protein n=1 Tax=Asticcacaulis sp. AND118 TaxID=2840468 RepID=UPI001CFFAE07|nr:hypothetical protein [Asticcacaulis sp. AND118]UDF02419.1 hypothetical protein LH365_08180 [Asticcacaulis sp. AND118]
MSEFLLELHRNGAYLKVIAVDPVSGEEVSTVGPASDPQAVKRLAVQKLKNRLEALKPPPLNKGRGGIIC